MTEETVALIYKFLSEKDIACAEIFNRSFEPNLSCVENLPSLEDIVKQYLKSKKKAEPNQCSSEIGNIMSMVKSNPSDFLEAIVKKRESKNEEDTSETEEDEEITPDETSSSSENEPINNTARKRKHSEIVTKKKAGKSSQKNNKAK